MTENQLMWHFFFSDVPNLRYLFAMISIYNLIALWAIFEKAYEPGWGALIPLYNVYLYFKITWGNGWYSLLMLIPIVNIAIGILSLFKLARAFGKRFWFGIGLVLLHPVFVGILAFGSPQYSGVPSRDDSFDL